MGLYCFPVGTGKVFLKDVCDHLTLIYLELIRRFKPDMDLTLMSQKNSQITVSISMKEEQEILQYIYIYIFFINSDSTVLELLRVKELSRCLAMLNYTV